MSLPTLSRECSIIGESFTTVLGVTKEDIERLWEQAKEAFPEDTLMSLHARTPRDLAIEVYASEDVLSLWLGPVRLARLARRSPEEPT